MDAQYQITELYEGRWHPVEWLGTRGVRWVKKPVHVEGE